MMSRASELLLNIVCTLAYMVMVYILLGVALRLMS